MTPAPAYRVHGLVVRCPFPLPCRGAPPASRPDLVLDLALPAPQAAPPAPLHPLQDGPRGGAWLEAGSTGEGFLLRYRGYADVLAAPGERRATVRPVPGIGRATLRLLVLDSALPHLLALRGETVLHAAAVDLGAGAAAFLGPAGAGKSTLAALLARAGCPVLADDALRVRGRGRRLFAETGPAVLRLRPEARRLAGPGLGRSRPDARISGKVRVDLGSRGLGGPRSGSPLRGLFVLGDPRRARRARRVTLEPLRPPGAVAAVADALFRVDLRDRGRLRREFEAAARLAAAVPAFRLIVPRARRPAPDALREALAAALHGKD